MKEVKYKKHLAQFGMWAAIKKQNKLKRGLVEQFGRVTFE
jgi:hypothetical protein